MVEPMIVGEKGSNYKLAVNCRFCGKDITFHASKEGYDKRMNGELIQRCWPNMNPAIRELMVSGMCPDCWYKEIGPAR